MQLADQAKGVEELRADKFKLDLELNLLRTKSQSLSEKLSDKGREAADLAVRHSELLERFRRLELAGRETEQLRKELAEKSAALEGKSQELEELLGSFEEEEYEEENITVLKKKHRHSRRELEELQAEFRETLEQNLKGQEEIKALLALNRGLEQRLKEQKSFYDRTLDSYGYEQQAMEQRIKDLEGSHAEGESVSDCSCSLELENLSGELGELRVALIQKERENDLLSDRVLRLQYDLAAYSQPAKEPPQFRQYAPTGSLTDLQQYYSAYINGLHNQLHSCSLENSRLLHQMHASHRTPFRMPQLDCAVSCELLPSDLFEQFR